MPKIKESFRNFTSVLVKVSVVQIGLHAYSKVQRRNLKFTESRNLQNIFIKIVFTNQIDPESVTRCQVEQKQGRAKFALFLAGYVFGCQDQTWKRTRYIFVKSC